MPRTKTPDPISDEVREFLRKSEQALADARQRWGENLRDLVPGDGARIRKVIDDVFDFTETLLKQQREFANSVVDAVLGEEPAKPASAPKRTAPPKRRAPAKRAAKPKPSAPASAA